MLSWIYVPMDLCSHVANNFPLSKCTFPIDTMKVILENESQSLKNNFNAIPDFHTQKFAAKLGSNALVNSQGRVLMSSHGGAFYRAARAAIRGSVFQSEQ